MRRTAAMLALCALAACSANETLTPVTAAAPIPVPPAAPTTQAFVTPSVSTPTVSAGIAPNPIATTHLEIAPVTGAPREAVPPLSQAMAQRGREIGLDFTRGGAVTTHTMRGFFSINDDGGELRVVYIWDVVTPDGRRVHRIRGQQAIPGTLNGNDPWRGVSAETMARIGRETIDRFAAWRQG